MKQSVRYGFYLGVALILSYIFYYFVHPISMFGFYSKATIWELLLVIGFIFFAISKNINSELDSGTSFKVALITLLVGTLFSYFFKSAFTLMLADELNPIYLEASKADIYSSGDFFNADPLETLEEAELFEKTLDENFKFGEDIIGGIIGLLMWGIPFAAIISFFSRQVLKFRKT